MQIHMYASLKLANMVCQMSLQLLPSHVAFELARWKARRVRTESMKRELHRHSE